MHILTLRPNATIITLIHKAFFHFLPIPRFNDINIQRFPSNALFLFSLSLSLPYLPKHIPKTDLIVNNLPIVFPIVPDIVSTRHKSITVARRTLAYNAFRKTLPGCRKHRFYAHSIFRDLRSRNNSSRQGIARNG